MFAPPIPVIDLFAGPGGLGEGFASLRSVNDAPLFKIRLSIEKDATAHQTLELRAFFRQFPDKKVPQDYYRHLRGELSRGELFSAWPREAQAAKAEAWCAELGKVASRDVRKRIQEELGNNNRWVLIGGPPCQAYSSIGRARNKGNDDYVPANDPRQYLYVEYLQILADHRPAVFVMENVKGLVSATIHNQRMFDRILDDLHSPWSAIRREGRTAATKSKSLGYRIYSLEQASLFGDCELGDFVVRTERHGIPQARHRVILLGIRDDVNAGIPSALPLTPPIPAAAALEGLPRLRSGISGMKDTADDWRRWIEQVLEEDWFRTLNSSEGKDIHDEIARAVKSLRLPRRDRGADFIPGEVSIQFAEEWYLDHGIGGVCNHSTRSHMGSDLYRYLFAACFGRARKRSPNLREFPESLLPQHSSVNDALQGGNFGDRFRVQLANRPATTVTSHIAKDGHYYIHYDPTQCRSLTVREAARLQTFPDNYLFCGGRTAQYGQVGNAVPPLMAREIAKIVAKILAS